MSNSKDIAAAYGELLKQKAEEGAIPTLLTFMFKPISGSKSNVAWQMRDEVERVFKTNLTFHNRKPLSAFHQSKMPLWLVIPDYPVYKTEREHLRNVSVNDGLHVHAIALTSIWSRMRISLQRHFDHYQHLYHLSDRPLFRIDAEPITRSIDFVTDYVMKSIKTGRVDPDEILILPRTLSEMR